MNMSVPHRLKCKCPGKAALLKGWKEIYCSDIDMVKEWMSRFEGMNIGTILGKKSGYIAVDIDLKEGEEIFNSLSGGKEYPTWSFSTPGGGRRLIYRIPDAHKDQVFNRADFEKGPGNCTFMGQGQQTVLPPSVHNNGGTYTWIISPYDCDCAEAPDWIVEVMTTSDDPDTTYDGLD